MYSGLGTALVFPCVDLSRISDRRRRGMAEWCGQWIVILTLRMFQSLKLLVSSLI